MQHIKLYDAWLSHIIYNLAIMYEAKRNATAIGKKIYVHTGIDGYHSSSFHYNHEVQMKTQNTFPYVFSFIKSFSTDYLF